MVVYFFYFIFFSTYLHYFISSFLLVLNAECITQLMCAICSCDICRTSLFFFRSLLIYSFIEVFRLAKWIIDKASLTAVIMSVCVSQKAYCGHCSERIWGLGRQGYKCINCKLLVHKRCHKLVPLTCQRHMVSLSFGSKNIHHLSVVTESINSVTPRLKIIQKLKIELAKYKTINNNFFICHFFQISTSTTVKNLIAVLRNFFF